MAFVLEAPLILAVEAKSADGKPSGLASVGRGLARHPVTS